MLLVSSDIAGAAKLMSYKHDRRKMIQLQVQTWRRSFWGCKATSVMRYRDVSKSSYDL